MKLPKFSGKPKKPKSVLVRRVVGKSMLPYLRPGAVVFALRTRRIRAGSVVIIQHNGLEKIKRVAALQPGRVYVLGDNSLESTDSRTLGWLAEDAVRARVIFCVSDGKLGFVRPRVVR